MVSSDIKGMLRKVLCVLKREELGEVVQKWGVFGEESVREVTHLANSVGRTVPRKSVTEKIVQECVVGVQIQLYKLSVHPTCQFY